MNSKFKPPCWVKHKESGQVLRCRSISKPNKRMKMDGWRGLVLHVQNENGTGIGKYSDFVIPDEKDLEKFNEAVKKKFGL